MAEAQKGSETKPGLSPVPPGPIDHKDQVITEEEPGLDTANDDPEAFLPTVMSPIRATSGSHSSKVYETSLSTLDSSATLSTPGQDISFGPQAIPFMLRRRAGIEVGESPIKGPNNTPSSLHKAKSAPLQIRHPDGSIEEVDEVVTASEEPVSSWRKDQVKYMRKGRMSKNPALKRIPTLNGPLSLPYARNPR